MNKISEMWNNFEYFLLGIIYEQTKLNNRIDLILNSIEFDID